MSELGFEFDTNEVEVNDGDFSPIPDGDYVAVYEDDEAKQTKDGTGAYISVKWRITGPTHANRVIYSMIHTKNKSDKAQEIGRRDLKKLCLASGHEGKLRTTDVFKGTPFRLTVRTERNPEHGDRNVVKNYKRSDVVSPTANQGQQLSQAAQKAPWM